LRDHAERIEAEIRALHGTLTIVRHKLDHYDELMRSVKRRHKAVRNAAAPGKRSINAKKRASA
jgi:hypothetical protein